MTPRRQRGILLLPVVLMLTVAGTLAYAMTREAGMSVADVDAQYDIEVTRYLASSGIAYAKWRAAMGGCDKNAANFGTLTLGTGKVVIDDDKTAWKKPFLTLSVKATGNRNSTNGAVNVLTRNERIVNLTDVKQATIIGPGDGDTTIVRNDTASATRVNADTLIASEGDAHPLVVFKLPADLDNASIIQADLKVTKKSGNTTQPGRALAVHRITRDWSAKSATWTSPWAAAGGDYVATPAASVAIDPGNGAFNGAYTWRIDALAQLWASDASQNFGVLLKPTALSNVPFISFDGSNKPELAVRYFKRCT